MEGGTYNYRLKVARLVCMDMQGVVFLMLHGWLADPVLAWSDRPTLSGKEMEGEGQGNTQLHSA